MYGALIDGFLKVAVEVLKYINTDNTRKYVDEMREISQELLDEESKGYDSDDRRIEYLVEKYKLAQNAFTNELVLNKAK